MTISFEEAEQVYSGHGPALPATVCDYDNTLKEPQ